MSQMMDQERTKKELQEVFEEIQRSYEKLIEDTFALQARTLKVSQRLFDGLSEAQSQSTRASLDSLAGQSESQRKALEELVRSSTEAFTTVLEAPYAHRHKVEQVKAVLEEASTSPEQG
jgi:predicted nuclease with TOPRIM domain